MEIRQIKLLELAQTAESRLEAKLEIDGKAQNIKVEVRRFEDFYGFNMPETVQVVLRNYPQVSRKIINCFQEYLTGKSLPLPIDFSLFARRQNAEAKRLEKQAA